MLTIKKAEKFDSVPDENSSPVQKSSWVHFKVFNIGQANDITDAGAPSLTDFWVIATEPLSYTISTSWKDSCGAAIAGKIDDLINSQVFKLFNAGKMFVPIVSDAWSQQVAEKGSPISISVKFRAYYKDRTTCSADYKSLIKFFTRLCSPPKKYSLSAATLGVLKTNAKTVKETAEKAGNAWKDNHSITAAVKVFAGAVTSTKEPSADGTGALRCQFTLTVETNKFKCSTLDWIVKSFSFTPSQQMVFENGKPLPLWVDFQVDLETDICPSNYYTSHFFTGK